MDNFLGEIRPTGFSFAPKGWALCNGQMLAIAQNQALFALLSTQFGGNGTTTFALPDLRGRVPVGIGQLAGGGNYAQGQVGGQEQVALTQTQMPTHTHLVTGTLQTSDSPDFSDPTNHAPAAGGRAQFTNGGANTTMGATASGTTANAGGSQGHENRMPYQAINYIIALQGIYPTRS